MIRWLLFTSTSTKHERAIICQIAWKRAQYIISNDYFFFSSKWNAGHLSIAAKAGDETAVKYVTDTFKAWMDNGNE